MRGLLWIEGEEFPEGSGHEGLFEFVVEKHGLDFGSGQELDGDVFGVV